MTRPVGPALTGFSPPPAPGPTVILGRYMQLERIDVAAHADDLFHACVGHDWIWDYIGVGPFSDFDEFRNWLASIETLKDPCFYAIRDQATGKVPGFASFMRIDPRNGVIEIGFIVMTPELQRTAASTEAISAMISWAFRNGYRRVEWKCDSLNAPSIAAAKRFGFSYEGTFRQHMIYKGHNRDTAWFAIIDSDWTALEQAHRRWLDPDNFDSAGRQKQSLSALTTP